jgi:anti-sigma factor RsiW
MDCEKVQDQILEGFDEARSAAMEAELDAHLADCTKCAAFAASHKAVDARLSSVLVPSEPSPIFRSVLRKRIAMEAPRWWMDALPDIVHFVSWTAATLLCAVLAPLETSVVLGAGTTGALLTYVLLTIVRNSFEDLERAV